MGPPKIPIRGSIRWADWHSGSLQRVSAVGPSVTRLLEPPVRRDIREPALKVARRMSLLLFEADC